MSVQVCWAFMGRSTDRSWKCWDSVASKVLPDSMWFCAATFIRTLSLCVRTLFPLAPQLLTTFKFRSFRFSHFFSRSTCRLLANRCHLLRSFLHLAAILCLQPPFNLIHSRLQRCFQLPQIPWWYMIEAIVCIFGWLLSFHVRKPSIYVTIRRMHSGTSLTRMPTLRPFLKQKGLRPLIMEQSRLVTILSRYVAQSNSSWDLYSHFYHQTLLFLIRRFVPNRRSLVNNGPLVALKPSLN